MTFLLYGTSLKIEYSSSMLRFTGAQLFSNFLIIIWMHLRVKCRAVPVALRVIQYRCNRVRYINNSSSVAAHDEEETIGSLENQMFQFLIGEKRRFVRPIATGVARSCKYIRACDEPIMFCKAMEKNEKEEKKKKCKIFDWSERGREGKLLGWW